MIDVDSFRVRQKSLMNFGALTTEFGIRVNNAVSESADRRARIKFYWGPAVEVATRNFAEKHITC